VEGRVCRWFLKVDGQSWNELAAAGLALTLELAVIPEGRAINLLENELTDGHAGVKGDVKGAEVDEFQCDCASKAGVDRRGGEVHEQAAARVRTFPSTRAAKLVPPVFSGNSTRSSV
jgi:hypothetical protein